MKRCFIIVALLLLSFVFTSALADEGGTWGELTWTLSDDGVLEISGNGPMDDFYPSSSDAWRQKEMEIKTIKIGNGITSIGSSAFQNCETLNNVTIPESVTAIGDLAFCDCHCLSSIIIPDSVLSIGNSTFSGSNLSKIQIPSSVHDIDPSAFMSCDLLTEIVVENGNNNYASLDGVLYDKNITQIICCPRGIQGAITLPNGITSIADSAFYDCDKITSVFIPESVTDISSWAFSYCRNLHEIQVADSNNVFSSIDGVLYSKDNTQLLRCPLDKEGVFSVREGVIELGNNAFHGCNKLTRITMPDSVLFVGGWVFENCTRLTDITLSNNLTTIGNMAFWGCDALTSIFIPENVSSLERVFYCKNLTEYQVSNENKYFTCIDGVLYDKALSQVIKCPMGKNGTYIIPNGVEIVSQEAFSGCEKLTDIIFPNSLKSIDYAAFASCKGLNHIYIPQNVNNIVNFAFSDCSNLIEFQVEINNSTFSSVDGIIYNKEQTELLTCPEGKTGRVSIPYGVTSINSAAFGYCEKVDSIHIPRTITQIDDAVFAYCSGLTHVTIPDSILSIGDQAFDGCRSLTDIYYYGTPEQWETIEIGPRNAALYSAQIHFVLPEPDFLLPASLTVIDSEAFSQIPAGSVIRIPEGVTSIADDAFAGSDIALIVPAGSPWADWATAHGIRCYVEETP